MIVQGQTTAFKQNLLSGLENFAIGTPYTYKIALYDALANLDNSTTAYTAVNEITGSGYTAGGQTLTVIPPTSDTTENTAWVSFATATWDPADFTCRGALIYNATTGAAVCVLNFGSDKTATTSFSVQFPVADATNAILRIS